MLKYTVIKMIIINHFYKLQYDISLIFQSKRVVLISASFNNLI